MADPTSKDYYEQVANESREEIAREDQEITVKVDRLIASSMRDLKAELSEEFGHAMVRSANLTFLERVLENLARDSADAAKSVMVDSRFQESRKRGGTILEAVFAGIEISEGSQ